MAEYKLLGGNDPAATVIGQITEGIGFPLRPVEPAVSGGDVVIKTEIALDSRSYIDQNPAGLGIDYQILFGAPDATTYFSIDAAGAATCLIADQYNVRLKLTLGREGAAQVAQLYVRLLNNGVPLGDPVHTIIDNVRIEIPQVFEGVHDLEANDILTVELVRDTDGNDDGGLRAGIPDVVGWGNSPSAQLQIVRTFATVTV